MPNTPPVPVLKVNITEITLPNVIIEWDATGSHDIDKNGNPVQRKGSRLELFYNGVAVDMLGQKTGKLSVAPVAGKFPLVLDMYDNREEKGSTTIEITIKPAVVVPPPVKDIVWLAKITQGPFVGQDKAITSLGINAVRPNGITLSSFNPSQTSRTDDFLNAGRICFVNVNWDNPTQDSIVPFYKDPANYRNKFVPLAQKYAPWAAKGKLRFLIENEETNRGYFSGDIEDYIELLKVAIDVCEEYGIPVSDGAVAAEYVQMLVNGDLAAAYERANSGKPAGRYDEQMIKTDKLLSFFKIVAYSEFVVVIHTMGEGEEYDRTNLKAVVDYIFVRTGKQTGCNEFHLVNATKELVDDIVQDFKDSGCIFVGIWDEKKGQGGAVTDGNGNLEPVGIWFRDAIK